MYYIRIVAAVIFFRGKQRDFCSMPVYILACVVLVYSVDDVSIVVVDVVAAHAIRDDDNG